MVRRSVDRGQLVNTGCKAFVDSRRQLPIHRNPIQALEESKCLGVGRLSLGERGQLLNNDVRVSSDLTSAIDLLRSTKVIGLRIDKVARLQIIDVHFNSEGLIGRDGAEILRK